MTGQIRAVGLAALLLAPACAHAALPADLLLFHGHILTVDASFSVHSVVVIKDGKIVAVGGDELRGRFAATKQSDLRGRTPLPGFTDTHLHPKATSPHDVDVAAAGSVADVQAMLRTKAQRC